LTKAHFKKVCALVEDVRRARIEGVPPLPCNCHVCSQRDDVRAVIRAGQDVALVSGIGNARAETLRRLGIRTVSDLAGADPGAVALRTRAFGGQTIGKAIIAAAQPHARALRDGVPVWLAEDRFEHEDLIALDIEYDSSASSDWNLSYPRAIDVFLVGALVRAGGNEQWFQQLVTSTKELGIALRELRDLIGMYSRLPIVT
jgi:predicted RecB family nuclease